MKEIVEVVRMIHQECVQRAVEEIVDFLVKVILQGRMSSHIAEQTLAVPQIQEHVVEVFKLNPQERVSERWRGRGRCGEANHSFGALATAHCGAACRYARSAGQERVQQRTLT